MLVFPCKDKRPLVEWTTAAKPMEEWDLEAYPEWGAPTGPKNDFFVVDFDVKSGGMETLKGLNMGTTWHCTTRNGGRHYYYRYPEGDASPIRNRAGILPGVDIRGDGGFVILYDDVDYTAISEAPAWLTQLLTQPEKALVEAGDGEVIEGGRNHAVARAAGQMQRNDVLTLAALMEWNERKCAPPLDAVEVEAIFNSIRRYKPDTSPTGEPAKTYERVGDLLNDFLDYISDEKHVSGDPIGIPALDEMLGGGIRSGEVVGILGQAKQGKSAFTHKIIHSWLASGIPVGYASRELRPATEVVPNLLSLDFRSNALKTKLEVGKLSERLTTWPLYFAKGLGPFPMSEIKPWMEELYSLGVRKFVFDHLIHIAGTEDYKIIAEVARGIKTLTLQLEGSASILAIQPKQINPDERVSFNSIRGGSAVGQAIDCLIILERERDHEGKLTDVSEVRLDIARHKLARPGSIYLQYDKNTMDYTVVEKVEAPDPTEPVSVLVNPIKPVITSTDRLPSFDGSKVAAAMSKRIIQKSVI